MKYFITPATLVIIVCTTFNCMGQSIISSRNAVTELPGIYSKDSNSTQIKKAGEQDALFSGTKTIPVTILDAREKEQKEGLSKREFFDKYGFVILDHTSAMSAEDWVKADTKLTKEEFTKALEAGETSDEHKKIIDEHVDANTPGKNIYAREIEELIRSVLPETRKVFAPAVGVLRSAATTAAPGKKTANGIHNDYALNFDKMVNSTKFTNMRKYQREFDDDIEAHEFMSVNFWRPVLPMTQPLRSMPLCFLDASTLSEEDIVSVELQLEGETVFEVTALKENPNHEFYFYPDMTTNEVVMFKQFHHIHDDNDSSRMPVFHSAFPDPKADTNTEDRLSFEYRVPIIL